jgi:hypothetical protein
MKSDPQLAISGDGKSLTLLTDDEYNVVAIETGKSIARHQWPQGNDDDFVLRSAISQDLSTLAHV